MCTVKLWKIRIIILNNIIIKINVLFYGPRKKIKGWLMERFNEEREWVFLVVILEKKKKKEKEGNNNIYYYYFK